MTLPRSLEPLRPSILRTSLTPTSISAPCTIAPWLLPAVVAILGATLRLRRLLVSTRFGWGVTWGTAVAGELA